MVIRVFFSNKNTSEVSAGKNLSDLNITALIAMRENSKGYAELEPVFAFMNLVSLMNVNTFYKPIGDIGNNCKKLQKKVWKLQQRKSGN